MRRTGLILCVLLGVGGMSVGEARASAVLEWLPRLQANLRGVTKIVEGRPIEWQIEWAAAAAGAGTMREGEITLRGADLTLRAAVVFDSATGRLTWKVSEGRVSVGPWLTALARRPGWEVLAGINATGELIFSGDGERVDGVTTGTWSAEWRDATIVNETQGWSLAGVRVRGGGEWAELSGESRRIPMRVDVGTITTGRFGARNFSTEATLIDFARVEVSRALIEIAGGEVAAAPFNVALTEPALDVTLDMKRVGLQDLVVFVPTALTDARGRVNGRLRLAWSAADGLLVQNGNLSLEPSEPTTLRLAASPGFLTEKVPARFTLLPAWLGPVARWFSPVNPSYDTLSRIELGRLGLRVESLDVRLSPDGDERGRSASIFIRARPEHAGSAVDEVTFQINVSGPLAYVLRMGAEQKLSVDIR